MQRSAKLLASINICNYCNNRCIYCKEGRRDGPEYVPLSLPEIKRNIARLVIEKKVNALILMGGEVTLRPDFIEILKFIRFLKVKVGVGTNLIRFSDDEFFSDCAPYISFIEASVPAVTEKEYRLITRSANFSKFLRGAANVGRAKIPITANIVFTRHAASHLRSIINFISTTFPAGLRMATFKIPEMKGAAFENTDKMCDPVEALRLLAPILSQRRPKLLMMVQGAPLCLMRGIEQFSQDAILGFAKDRSICVNNKTLVPEMKYQRPAAFFPECRECEMTDFCAVPTARPTGISLINKLAAREIMKRLARRFASLGTWSRPKNGFSRSHKPYSPDII